MISGTTLWGSFLILLGATILIKAIFGINIPLLRLTFAAFLIYLGISIITGTKFYSSNFCFQSSNVSKHSYNCIFGSRTIDLSDETSEDEVKKIHINTVFGATRIKLNPSIPTEIRINSVLGNVILPDGSTVNFGNLIHETHPGQTARLIVKIDTVFGQAEFV